MGTATTKGSRLFAAWLEKERDRRKPRVQKDVAEALGISQSYLSLIKDGERRPTYDVLVRIEREAHIPLSAWAVRPDGTPYAEETEAA
jgi:transcriptional regulator with XRE-family HTH domain